MVEVAARKYLHLIGEDQESWRDISLTMRAVLEAVPMARACGDRCPLTKGTDFP